MKTINNNKKQGGFAMLEVMLAIVIIAIASFGIYKLYDSSSTNSKLSAEEDTISQIASAADKISYRTGLQPTAADLKNSGYLSDDMWKSATDSDFYAAFGTLTYTLSADKTYYTIQITNVPASATQELATNLSRIGDVKIDGTAFDPAKALTAAYSGTHTITFSAPKGAGS